jgi:hypothetical protein
LNTLRRIVAEGHHNSTGNRSGVIAHLEHLFKVLQIFLSFEAAGLSGRGKTTRFSALMFGTQQVHEINDMQRVITR